MSYSGFARAPLAGCCRRALLSAGHTYTRGASGSHDYLSRSGWECRDSGFMSVRHTSARRLRRTGHPGITDRHQTKAFCAHSTPSSLLRWRLLDSEEQSSERRYSRIRSLRDVSSVLRRTICTDNRGAVSSTRRTARPLPVSRKVPHRMLTLPSRPPTRRSRPPGV